MQFQGLEFERERNMSVYYRDFDIGTRRVDFFVENIIMVEIKAKLELNEAHLNQAINYLVAYNMKIGSLINFGGRSLQFKKVHNNKI